MSLLAQLDALSAAAAKAPVAKAPKAKGARGGSAAGDGAPAAAKPPKAPKAARTATAKAKPKARAAAGKAREPAEDADEATLLALQTQVRAFGLRPAAGAAALRAQLAACQAALHERETEAAAGDASMHSTWSAPADGDEPGDVTMQLVREADTDAEREPSSDEVPLAQSTRRARRRRSASAEDDAEDDASSGADEPAEAAPGAVERTLDEALQRAVRADAQLRRRILQYEPVAFDEVMSVAARAGVRVKKKDDVRDWLDAQGICFYSTELTGARSRH